MSFVSPIREQYSARVEAYLGFGVADSSVSSAFDEETYPRDEIDEHPIKQQHNAKTRHGKTLLICFLMPESPIGNKGSLLPCRLAPQTVFPLPHCSCFPASLLG